MGRPKVTEQRVAEILDAFEICVADYGVEGATLERIAEQAGLARALIRHHVGNRDALLDRLVERFIAQAAQATLDFSDFLPSENRIEALLEGLFDAQYSNSHQMRVTSALLIAMKDRPELATALRSWTLDFIGFLEKELQQAFPEGDVKQVGIVAAGVATLYFNVDSIAAMGDMEAYRQNCVEASSLLVSSLEICS